MGIIEDAAQVHAALVRDARRYRYVRRMHPMAFHALFWRNITEGVPLDALIDELMGGDDGE
jgi:hypothetical protein